MKERVRASRRPEVGRAGVDAEERRMGTIEEEGKVETEQAGVIKREKTAGAKAEVVTLEFEDE